MRRACWAPRARSARAGPPRRRRPRRATRPRRRRANAGWAAGTGGRRAPRSPPRGRQRASRRTRRGAPTRRRRRPRRRARRGTSATGDRTPQRVAATRPPCRPPPSSAPPTPGALLPARASCPPADPCAALATHAPTFQAFSFRNRHGQAFRSWHACKNITQEHTHSIVTHLIGARMVGRRRTSPQAVFLQREEGGLAVVIGLCAVCPSGCVDVCICTPWTAGLDDRPRLKGES
jgi:hypothetical protein